ncbi:MAG TPA: DUF99 family protein [Deltaproteobacteria bacterium]|nr:DUF99 family protein [Deltaproteobacteria bacterium]
MGSLAQVVGSGRNLCTIGFDDAPFERRAGAPVQVAGVVCSGTRFEGLLWGHTTKDGTDATEVLAEMLVGSKFAPQLHLVLCDGVTVGGLNVIDLITLHEATSLPCVSVMRRLPDLQAIRRVVQRLPDPELRWHRIQRAGTVHQLGGFTFQVVGAEVEDVATALSSLTDRGRVPEPLRLAHLIGSAVVRGESSNRA